LVDVLIRELPGKVESLVGDSRVDFPHVIVVQLAQLLTIAHDSP
jgi:hypothetical protein